MQAFLLGRGVPNSGRAGGRIEGFDEGAGRDRHNGPQQEEDQIVRAELCGGQVDQRGDADGKDTEHAKDGDSDSDELHHAGLDVNSLCKVVSTQEWYGRATKMKNMGLIYLKAVAQAVWINFSLDEIEDWPQRRWSYLVCSWTLAAEQGFDEHYS
jgi:hypothetical protein